MRRLVALVAMMLVVGVWWGRGVCRRAPAVGQATPESGLCDAGGIAQFSDVQDSDYAAAYILCMRALGLSQGIRDGDYGPDGELNRGQMASFLIRLWTDHLGEQCPSGVVVPFTDTGGTTHEANIECLFGLGITQGTSATTYGPGDPLTGVADLAVPVPHVSEGWWGSVCGNGGFGTGSGRGVSGWSAGGAHDRGGHLGCCGDPCSDGCVRDRALA